MDIDRNLTAVEIVGLAITKEREAQHLYRKIAQLIKNPLVEAKFGSLAREEARHEQVLSTLYGKMAGGGKPRVPKRRDDPEPPLPKGSEESLEPLFLFAIEREREAQVMYRRAAEIAGDESGRRALTYLADFEHGHEVLLTNELEAYRKNRDWYANNPDLMIVGP